MKARSGCAAPLRRAPDRAEGIRVANQARVVLASFPEVTVTTSQVGRPDDGTDFTGFFNTEYCVNLKPKGEWRPVFHQDKEKLIAAMNRELKKIPGAVWNFSQPIQDNMEEAVSGVKGQLATKIYGDDLRTLEAKGQEVVNVMRHIKGIQDLGLFRVVGQPNLNFVMDRKQAARYQINVADVQDAIQTAIGGNAVTQVLKGEQRYDLVVRYLPPYRDTKEALEKVRLLAPSGERVSLAQFCAVETRDGAAQIYREGNRRYVAVKYSVRGRDLGSTVEEAMAKVDRQVKLPRGYSINWLGEYESQVRAEKRLLDRGTPDDLPHLHDHLRRLRLRQVGVPQSGQRGRGSGRRFSGAARDRYVLQRLLRGRVPGSGRSLRSGWRHHDRVYQSAAHARLFDR